MGRRKRRQDEIKKANQETWGTKNKRGEGYDDIVRENAIFDGYYKAQKVVPEEEWDSFLSHLKEPLPASFRIAGCRSQATELLKIIQGQYFTELTKEQVEPKCLPWYPDKLAWQLNLTRKDIRKSEANVHLHNFLVSETDSGNISRQETVSMIPPLVLDVKPHHKVLDMCAAPGSKTAQLVEMLHAEEGKIPEGVVVANDANNKRCYMLVHQAKRLQSPCIFITNHDATVMPNILVPSKEGGEEHLKFDRILCDVPCSGDGTLRKNFDVWMKWNTANGNNLHGVQYRVARRGAEMLALGGLMVYSTCSLNPIEDEAVIHRLLLEAKGSLELVDISNKLPGLKYCRGLSHWVIMDRDLTVYEKPEDVPDKVRNLIRPAIYPPKPEDAESFHLDRCIRILPHQQNTGGFFVALLKKVTPLPWESTTKSISEQTQPQEQPAEEKSGRKSPARKKRRTFGYKEDPFFFFDKDEPIWPSIRDFYGIKDDVDPSLFFTRCKEGKKKNIYFANSTVRNMTKLNEGKVQIINTGIKMFVRSDNKGTDCCFRLAQEGAPVIIEYITKRRVAVNREDMKILLLNDDMMTPPEISTLSQEAAKQLEELDTGSVVLEYREESLHIILVGWKGKTSVRAYIPKNERVHYLRLCGGDVSKFEINKFKDRAANNPDTLEAEADDSCVLSEHSS